MRLVLASMIAALVGLPGLGCSSTPPLLYRAEAIDGNVVDDDTRKPIEGVIVVAQWEVVGGFMEAIPMGDLEILETVTDAEGAYHFDAWGPREIIAGHFFGNDPGLIFFKPGYEFKSLRNSLHPPGAGSPMYDEYGQARCVWSGKTIDLKPETPSQRIAQQHLIDMYVPFQGKPCSWKKMPRLLVALISVVESAPDGGAQHRRSVLETLESERHPDCGSVEEFLRRFQ